jgi:hypothetical protein
MNPLDRFALHVWPWFVLAASVLELSAFITQHARPLYVCLAMLHCVVGCTLIATGRNLSRIKDALRA